MKGTRGRRGSSPLEQNHSGILCHLNDGERSQNKYCEAPITLIRDLFDRQKYHINKWNIDLAKESMEMDIEVMGLNKEPQTALNIILTDAAKILSKKSYLIFKTSCFRAYNTLQHRKEINNDGDNVSYISSIDSITAKPREFKVPYQSCSFHVASADEMQCPHEIKIHGCFKESLFDYKHFRRTSVQGSVAGWNPDSRTEIDEAIALPIDEDSENDDNDSNNLVSATAQLINTERESIDMTSEKEPTQEKIRK